MPTPWLGAKEFNAYLEKLLAAAGIKDRAELSRLSGVSQTQLTNWNSGTHRPSRNSLRKIAVPLGVPARDLWIKAEIATAEELGVDEPTDEVLPRDIREFHDRYAHADEAGRARLLEHIALVNNAYDLWLAAQPKGKRRAS